MQKLRIGYFLILFSCFNQCNKEKQPINVLIEYINLNSIPVLKLTFVNTSNEAYTINDDLFTYIEIENRPKSKYFWIQNDDWFESESSMSENSFRYLDSKGNFEKRNFENFYSLKYRYRLVIPAKAKVTKNISLYFIDYLLEHKRDVRTRFNYDYYSIFDNKNIDSVNVKRVEKPIISEYFYFTQPVVIRAKEINKW